VWSCGPAIEIVPVSVDPYRTKRLSVTVSWNAALNELGNGLPATVIAISAGSWNLSVELSRLEK
jgi:hypothetical protein